MAQPMTNKKRVSLAKKYIEQVDRVDLEEEEEHDDDLDVLSDHDNLIVQDDHARSNVMGTAYGTSSPHSRSSTMFNAYHFTHRHAIYD
jgi:hypothetical protein